MNLFLLPHTILKGEGTSFHEGGFYFISLQNGSTLNTHLLIDANETEVERKSKIFKMAHGQSLKIKMYNMHYTRY
jgi:hypothetical protein